MGIHLNSIIRCSYLPYIILPLFKYLFGIQTWWAGSFLSVFQVACWKKSNEAWLPLQRHQWLLPVCLFLCLLFALDTAPSLPFRNLKLIVVLLLAVLQSPFGIFHSSCTEAVWARTLQLMAVFIPEFFWIPCMDAVWSQQLLLSQFSFITSLFCSGHMFQEHFLPFDLLLALQRHLNGLTPPDWFEK